MHRLDVDPQACRLGARVPALLTHLVLDPEVDALLVRLQLGLGCKRLAAVIADVVPAVDLLLTNQISCGTTGCSIR